MISGRRIPLHLAGVAILCVLIGCSGPAPVTPPPSTAASQQVVPEFPARTDQLRLDGINACELLTADQQTALNAWIVRPVNPPKTNSCTYGPMFVYVFTTARRPPLEESATPPRLVRIENFNARESQVPGIPTNCALNIDMAENQSRT